MRRSRRQHFLLFQGQVEGNVNVVIWCKGDCFNFKKSGKLIKHRLFVASTC